MAVPWREIASQVYIRRYPFFDQTIGAIVSGDEVAVVDTRTTPSHAAELLGDLRALARLRIAAVINTHGHSDHCFGNAAFRPAPIWGHERCERMIRDTWRAQRDALAAGIPEIAGDLAEVEAVEPDRTFADEATVRLGSRKLELRWLGRGHTDNDIVIAVPDANVLFVGDLLESGAPPFFGDGYPLDWPETADRLALATDEGTVVVPGHGEPAGRALVLAQASDIRRIADLARAVASDALTLEDALDTAPYGPEASREPMERALWQIRQQPGARTPSGAPTPS